MYQVAYRYRVSMGPFELLGVRVVQTIGFHKMEISPVDAAD